MSTNQGSGPARGAADPSQPAAKARTASTAPAAGRGEPLVAGKGRKRIARLYVTLVAAAALAAASCSAPAERWNVLLVTFDTTRADRLGCYGNGTIRTPTVDRLAAEGVRFESAWSAAPITLPSHTTILTGAYPIAHGVRDNGLFVVPESSETLAETLAANGYATAAAIGAFPLVAKFGLDQGFELYDDRLEAPFDTLDRSRSSRPRLYFEERKAARVNEAIFPWLESNAGRPLFLWVHYYDPHQPLEPPPPYDQLYATDPYDGELAYADESLGTLLARFERLGILGRTLVVFTSDHGEGLGEHGEATHSYLTYNGTLRVPLIFRLPGGPRGRVVPDRARAVDIVPTVLDLLGLAVPAPVQGRSLAGFLAPEERAPEAPRPHYAETLSPRLANGWGELRALFDGDWKYIHGPRPELFDIAADPRELANRIGERPELARDMREKLSSFLRTHAVATPAATVGVDEETVRRLQALGYLHGSGEAAGSIREELRDGGIPPQDRVGDVTRMTAAKDFLLNGRPLPAYELAEGLLADDPTNRFYLELRAHAELNLGRIDEARATLEDLLAEDAGAGGAERLMLRVGQLLFLQGRRAEGLASVERSLERKPDANGRYLLATMMASELRPEEARRQLVAALEVDPDYAPARVDLAIRLAEDGDRPAAEIEFRRALAGHPYDARAHFNFGAFRHAGGEAEPALRLFLRALELAPDYRQAYEAAATVARELGRVREADELDRRRRERFPARPETVAAKSGEGSS